MRATGPGLVVTLVLDGQVFFTGTPSQETQKVDQMVDDNTPRDHLLEIILSGKCPEHTKLDAEGAIVQDRLLIVEDISLDQVSLGQILHEKAVYCHDYNGTKPMVDGRFYGEMGCNGTVKLSFTSPIYLWLLENM